ncbi:hypothetical protein [Amycolatopsis vancoresmycina]|uniref:DUF2185 domain-containing protein n=1 Tax=Amycolatopsis vancoresmycina DSM 44592 TaxID=1292037 RepID=R1GFQ9_9PSEU|nr:hypothetical protein [Amycolatopsis vancoresmycina]EOD70008.1 hypothetical protein H480_03386 [Amycolatopsis vancoresmycina DSM 44592]
MSTDWPLRQDPEGPVIIALALVNDPAALGFVVLDDEDDWFISDGTELSDDVLVNRESFGKLSLREAFELLPQLGALAGLPTGMAADWDPERRTWLLSSVTGSDDEDEDVRLLAQRRAAWQFEGSPDDEAQISTGLTEIPTGPQQPVRAVRQVVREQDGTWLFVGFEVPEAEDFEVEGLELEHVANLYPDVRTVLKAGPGQVYDRATPDSDWELVEG